MIQNKRLYFASTPQFADLCQVIVSLPLGHNQTDEANQSSKPYSNVQTQSNQTGDEANQSSKPYSNQTQSNQTGDEANQSSKPYSNHSNQTQSNPIQSNVIKCRELLFTEPAIIATPSIANKHQIMIILQKNVYKTGKLHSRLKKMRMEAEKPRRVQPSDYQCCLQYTLQAKLAPQWNRVGQYFVQGRDFLTSRNKLNAVESVLTVHGDEMYFNIGAEVIKIPFIHLHDLDILPAVTREFFNSGRESAIEEYSIGSKWCHILPSMKKGQVVRVLQKLPSDGPYKSYNELKRYWKNNYGYRLPAEDEGMLYYQVYFKPIGGILFTYPECCIRPYDIRVISRCDTQVAVEQFVSDVATRLGSVCGQAISLNTKCNYVNSAVQSAGQVNIYGNNQWLTERAPPTRDIYRPSENSQQSSRGAHGLLGSADVIPPTQQQERPQKTSSDQVDLQKQPPDMQAEEPSKKQSGTQDATPGFRPICPSFSTHKHRPVFTSAIKQQTHRPDVVGKPTPKFTPTFTTGRPTTQMITQTLSTTPSQSNTSGLTPNSQPPFSSSVSGVNCNSLQHQPKLEALPKSSTVRYEHLVPTWRSQPGATPASTASPQPLAPVIQSDPQTSQAFQQFCPSTNIKRKHNGCSDAGGVLKKPRSKPRVDESADVASLIVTEQSHKVNSVTLVWWLKMKGISCKTSEKKKDLVSKAQKYLNVYTQPEC